MEKIGEIQAIRKDGKAIEIENIWFQFFKPNFAYQKGQNVKVEYTVNKGFNNIKKIELSDPEWTKEPIYNPIANLKEDFDKIFQATKKMSDTTVNCLVMQSVQHSLNKDIKLSEATKEVTNCYKEITS